MDAARGLTIGAVLAGIFSFVCLVAVPDGFDLNACVILWSFVLVHTLLTVDRHAPAFEARCFAVFAAVVAILCLLAFVQACRGVGAALVVCFLVNVGASAAAVAWRGAAILRP